MAANQPTVTIVIVSMNSAAFIGRALDSIQAQSYPMERIQTVVVDHDSHDGTQELVARTYPWVNLIAERTNHGFAGGNNIGMKAFPADYFALVNPDVVLDPNWLAVLIDALETEPTIGVTGSKIFYGDGKLLQHAGAMFRDNALTYHLGDRESDSGQHDVRRDVDYVMGAACVTRGNVAARLGYLPEAYFPAYYEEADFCTQVRKAGFRVAYIPEAVAFHDEKHSGSGTMSRRFLRRYHKHRYLYALRNLTTSAERDRFRQAERAWRRQYAGSITARLFLTYSKWRNWRDLLRNPWLIGV